MNAEIDSYLAVGCGRCPLGGTPDCKVHDWQPELKALRGILLDCGLTEELKWKIPCYTVDGGNVLNLAAMKDGCAIGFFKGALLDDPEGILEKPGEHSQAARRITFTDVATVHALEPVLRRYVQQAVALEKAGAKVEFKSNPEPVPDELQAKLDELPELQAAFAALTPGRQRSHIIYVSGAKQSATRASRVLKCMPKILAGKGYLDR